VLAATWRGRSPFVLCASKRGIPDPLDHMSRFFDLVRFTHERELRGHAVRAQERGGKAVLRKKALPTCVLACFSMSLFAQTPKSLKVEDLGADSSPADLARAHADLKNGGAILRVTGGNQKEIEHLIGVPLLGATVKTATGQHSMNKAGLSSTPSLQMTAAAAYKDKNGAIRSAVVFSPTAVGTAAGEESSLKHLNAWVEQEQARALAAAPAESVDPEPPPEAWTAIYRTTVLGSDAWQSDGELTVGVFRLNSISRDKDYYMVATVPQTKPNFDGTCYGLHCGWHTLSRSLDIGSADTTPAGDVALIDHGPTGTITDSESGFEVGGDLNAEGPGISVGYSASWSTPSVVTTDHSDGSAGHWEETMHFSGGICNPVSAPVTSTGAFLSRQAAIFAVPAETAGITVPIRFVSHMCWYDFINNPFNGTASDIVIQLSVTVGPPLLSVHPSNLTIPAGGTGLVSVGDFIPYSEEGFSWTAETNDSLVATIPSRGPFSTGRLFPITVKPGVQDGETATISINSDPPYAAPAVRSGPLEVTVTVGTPKKQPVSGVLLVGGEGETGVESSSQVYDFTSNTVVDTQLPNVGRIGHTATLLKDGRVLIIGGQTGLSNPPHYAPVTATAETYDPSQQNWTATAGSLNTARAFHTATRLPDGKVLIAGGINGEGGRLSSAELYDPATGKFTPTGNMLEQRSNHYSVLLPNSGGSIKVLIYGGQTPASADQKTAEIWDESTGAFTVAGSSPSPILWTPNAVPLENGELDSVGGISPSGEATGDETLLTLGNPPSFSTSAAKLNEPRFYHTLTALPNNEGLLVTGGLTAFQHTLQDAELRDETGWNLLSAQMLSPRYQHTATLLPNGKVFIAGGDDLRGTTELYDPASKSFTAGPSMTPRASHTATLFSTTITDFAASPVNPVFGQSVTLSAHVTAALGSPTGTVQFLDGGSVIANATLSDGQATAAYAKFSGGAHTLTAVYSGNDLSSQSSSAPVTVNVQASSSSVALSSSVNPSEVGQDVTFVASVHLQSGTGNSATGTVTLKDGDTVLDRRPLRDNQASFLEKSLQIGSHSITATYSGDPTYGPSTSGVIHQVVSTRTTTVTLKSEPSAPVFGQKIMFMSVIASVDKDLPPNFTGTVTYKDGDTILGTVNLKGDLSNFETSSLHAGSHNITAIYSGDDNSRGSTSPVLAVTVAQTRSATSLQSSTNPSTPGEPVTFTAHVTSSAGTPSGTVVFSDDATPIGTAQPLVSGIASLSTSALSAGAHVITAAYSGDQDFSSSSSSALRQQINGASTTTSLQSSVNPSALSQTVTFTATVSSTLSGATGTVTFEDGGTSFAAVPLIDGTALASTSSLASGNHSITAHYSGDTAHTASTSSPLSQTVQPANDKFQAHAVIVSAPNPSKVGEAVTFTVTVTSDGGGTPTGSITVSEGAIIYGSAPLINGVGEVSNPNISVGSHQVNATYGGDGTHTGDTSAFINQVVNGFGARPPVPSAPSISISASNGSRNGTQLPVLLTIVNTGAAKVESIDFSQITLRTLAGAGEATIASPGVPIQVGGLLPRGVTTVSLILNVPSTLRKLAITENGTLESNSTSYQFSLGQLVLP
jgi:hypothetical protein